MRSLSNILFVHHKLFTYKMDDDGLLDHINKVETLRINLFAWRYMCKTKMFSKLFSGVSQSHTKTWSLEDNANEGVDYRVRDDTFDI